ncbi:hypothetical protein RRG08_019272 [Elysia crispata]|uniref:Uncharacterized protein n=1 Tax=Elysia crispata TaxID=231223 RepID=A0AAE0Y9D6_9GAST|nr:hypothetical protein RRG08_019272 [Elysia crispata]
MGKRRKTSGALISRPAVPTEFKESMVRIPSDTPDGEAGEIISFFLQNDGRNSMAPDRAAGVIERYEARIPVRRVAASYIYVAEEGTKVWKVVANANTIPLIYFSLSYFQVGRGRRQTTNKGNYCFLHSRLQLRDDQAPYQLWPSNKSSGHQALHTPNIDSRACMQRPGDNKLTPNSENLSSQYSGTGIKKRKREDLDQNKIYLLNGVHPGYHEINVNKPQSSCFDFSQLEAF